MTLRVRRLHNRAILPVRANPRDAGLDVFGLSDLTIKPGEIVRVPTGLALQAQPLKESQDAVVILVWDKSSRAAAGLKTMGGVIDEAYTGEIVVVLTNLNFGPLLQDSSSTSIASRQDAIDHATVRIPYGKAIAQLLIQTVRLAEPMEVAVLEETDRGNQGFGSSAVS